MCLQLYFEFEKYNYKITTFLSKSYFFGGIQIFLKKNFLKKAYTYLRYSTKCLKKKVYFF